MTRRTRNIEQNFEGGATRQRGGEERCCVERDGGMRPKEKRRPRRLRDREMIVRCGPMRPGASANDGGLHASEGTPSNAPYRSHRKELSHKLERDWRWSEKRPPCPSLNLHQLQENQICSESIGKISKRGPGKQWVGVKGLELAYATPHLRSVKPGRADARPVRRRIIRNADPTSMGGGKDVWSNRMAVDIASGSTQRLTGKDLETKEDEWNEHGWSHTQDLNESVALEFEGSNGYRGQEGRAAGTVIQTRLEIQDCGHWMQRREVEPRADS
ncbi:hypothetical protein B0H11DRAFT_1917775 [Mycena galericulata]|nr:hypothetical protein B0H11DRAFT_1917775 [Mycena galericulata]